MTEIATDILTYSPVEMWSKLSFFFYPLEFLFNNLLSIGSMRTGIITVDVYHMISC